MRKNCNTPSTSKLPIPAWLPISLVSMGALYATAYDISSNKHNGNLIVLLEAIPGIKQSSAQIIAAREIPFCLPAPRYNIRAKVV